MRELILSIKTISKMTKISVHSNRETILYRNIKHPSEELSKFDNVMEQFELRKNAVLDELKKSQIDLCTLAIIVAKGGLLKPMASGAYAVNDAMITDLLKPEAEHVSSLGGIVAGAIAKECSLLLKAVIVDPAYVDEMDEIAKISGMPELPRRSILHTLSQHAVANHFANSIGKPYDTINVIVAHLGTGISVGAHRQGKIVDVNNGLNGDGPMSPSRSGAVPAGQLVELCFSGKFTEKEIMKKICGEGGLKAYIGTNDCIEVEKMIAEGNKKAALVYKAIAYQVAKEIGALSVVLRGKIDGILLSGGLAHGQIIIDEITDMVGHLAKVRVYPGENEMQALANYGYLILNNEIEVKEYI